MKTSKDIVKMASKFLLSLRPAKPALGICPAKCVCIDVSPVLPCESAKVLTRCRKCVGGWIFHTSVAQWYSC